MIVIGVETCSFSRILKAHYTYEKYVIVAAVTVTVSLVVIVTVTVIIF